ncbi:peptidoglycan DD-metalloendopeptidase family protein [Kribbella sp. CA-247076]|uniref:peptidoglycan DD-metalloendopeptidase family protein n=1 Tax=Kribbella sp. CA-247076 TaxID=3239941 RepID=UPI003D8E63AF
MNPIRSLLPVLPLVVPVSWTVATTAPAAAASEPAVWPLTPRPAIVHPFDLPAKPWLPGHRGVDLSGSPGQPVRSATAGTITYAGHLAGRGVVVVSTGPRRTTYEPVVPSVEVGTPVHPGTVVGRLSAAGSHCAPATCLHWGLLEGKHYLNPLTLLPTRPVRLLPHTPRPQPDPGSVRHAARQHPAHVIPHFAPSPPAEHGNPAPTSPGADPPQVHALADPPVPRGERTAAAVVATTAALTVGAGLLIRRH